MRTLLPDPPPAEFEQLLERRRRWSADTHDEVWEGVLHMNPSLHGRHAKVQAQVMEILGPRARAHGLIPLAEFNLGEAEDYRIPDGGLQRPGPDELYYPTAALVLEVVSPGDESWEKLPFYARHNVDEILIVDPNERAAHWLALHRGEYGELDRSGLVVLSVAELEQQLDWPPVP